MHNIHPLIILQTLSLLALPTLSLPTNLASPGNQAASLAPLSPPSTFPAYLDQLSTPSTPSVHSRQLPEALTDEIAKFSSSWRSGASIPVQHHAEKREALSFAEPAVHERQLPKAVTDAIARYSNYWRDHPIPVQPHHPGRGKREREGFGFAEPRF